MISRRELIKSGGCAAALMPMVLAAGTAAKASGSRRIVARTGEAHLLEAGQPKTPVWGYDGQVPGPELRLRQGGQVAVDFVNELPQPTTVHWHGIRIDNRMDGVANLTQPAVKTGETFAYRFTAPDAGTFWYHPHNRTFEQLARGLYGPLIVEESAPPDVDQDRVLTFDDWRIGNDGRIDERSFGSIHDMAHAGRLGNVLTLNGQFSADVPVKAGQRLRLRLLNAANARVIGIRFAGHAPIIVALDGQPVDVPFVPDDNRIVLSPAQRADVILDCDQQSGTRTPIQVEAGRERLEVGKLVYDPARRQRPGTLTSLPALPPNPMPTDIDLKRAVVVDLVMEGGAMAPFAAAKYQGKSYGMRELVRRFNKGWAFNGVVGMPTEPLKVFERDVTAVVRMVNRTAWPHAMHFHGHHVREVAHSARKVQPHWRDTVLMQRGEAVAVAFKAHNPGRWMLHCHMLSHQAGGMSTWYEVR